MKEFWNQYASWQRSQDDQITPIERMIGTIVINVYPNRVASNVYMDAGTPEMLRRAERALVIVLRHVIEDREKIERTKREQL